MPLASDGASSGWDSFDVQSATTLYWKAVSFLVRQPDREEHVCELIVRILSGYDRTDHSSRVSGHFNLYLR